VSLHVLVVDDEPDIRLIARLALERLGGLQVTEADGADAAVAALTDAPPDVVLLDVMMPGTDGPATLARLRAHPAGVDLDVVFLTASVQRAEIARLHQLGVRGVLAKPFDPTTLADQLRALLADRQEPS
jgi:two-component system, OmpR family, response regulator